MSDRKNLILTASLVIVLLAACLPEIQEPTLVVPDFEVLSNVVSATGVVVPAREALLSVSAGGNVTDLFVEQGDPVNTGELLVKLEGSEAQVAAVSAAESELLNAQIALEALYKDTDLLAAESLKSAEAAEKALEDLTNNELQQAQARQTVAEAQKSVDVAERKLAIVTKPATQMVIEEARGNLKLAEKKHEETLDQIDDLQWQYKKYSSNKTLPAEIRANILTEIKQALKGLEVQRSQEQRNLEISRSRLNELLAPPDPVDVQVAEAELATAQALLNDAEKELERIMDGPQPGEVALLEAQINKGRQDFEIYSNGPDPQDIALAEARIKNAESQLEAARAMIADQQLLAPFDGVITAIHINPGEWIAPGSPVLQVGDLNHLHVETTDLSEFDVAKLEIGDPAVITFDSLPDVIIQGSVASIAPKAEDGSGVNYPVVIELEEIPATLRWGMTAFVDITSD